MATISWVVTVDKSFGLVYLAGFGRDLSALVALYEGASAARAVARARAVLVDEGLAVALLIPALDVKENGTLRAALAGV